jgi:hypothetical protein
MILAEVVSLFQAGKKIPSSRLGVLDAVTQMMEKLGDPSDRSRKCSSFGFGPCLPGEARKFSGGRAAAFNSPKRRLAERLARARVPPQDAGQLGCDARSRQRC